MYVVTYVNHLALRAQSQTNMASVWHPPIAQILMRETVFFWKLRSSGRKGVFEKMLTGSPLQSSRCFSLARFVVAVRPLFSHFCTDREPGTSSLHCAHGGQEHRLLQCWMIKVVHQVKSQIRYIALRVFQTSKGFWVLGSVNHLSGGGINANHNATHSPSLACNDSRLLKNSEGIRHGERNFCPYI